MAIYLTIILNNNNILESLEVRGQYCTLEICCNTQPTQQLKVYGKLCVLIFIEMIVIYVDIRKHKEFTFLLKYKNERYINRTQ